MSSSLDQRSSKGHENHDGNSQPAKEMEYHGYSADQQVPQAGYSSTQMPAGSASDSYVNYYAWNMPSYPTNPTGVMQEGVWSNRDSSIYSNYGQLANADYMQSGAMYNQYDYSYWYQGLDPSTTPWGPAGAMYKSRDYPNGSYYSAAGGSAGIPESTFNCDAGLNGAVQSMEQSFKGMSMAEEEKEIGGGHSSSTGAPANKKSWANVVTQQTSSRNAQRPKSIPRAPIAMLNKPSGEPGSTWDNKGSAGKAGQVRSSGEGRQVSVSGPYSNSGNVSKPASTAQYSSEASGDVKSSTSLNQTEYNPKEFDLNPKNARFFVIKSFSEDDIHRSIKYSIWCSTDYGNKRLDSAYREREGKGQVYLYFSVNGSGHFCGVALMTSPVDYHATAGVWAQDKWKGQFSVKWIYVKDVPNSQLRHIKLENNENKPVTNSRDTQEVPPEKGKQVLRIIHQYRHTTSIFDDFGHYEKQQEETSSGQRK